MDGDEDDFQLLLSSAGQEVRALRDDPRLRPLPGKRGAALREHVLDLLSAVEHRIAQQPASAAPQAVRSAFARSLRQNMVVLRGAHAALPWLAATRAPNVNLGSLYMTEEFARILVGTDVDLVVVPDPEFMYSTTSWPFGEVVNNTPGYTPATARRPIVLNYPLSDSDRLLLHPVFAHELGHASVDEHGLLEDVESALDANPAFVAAFQQTVTTMASTWPAASQSQVSGTVRAYLRSWIEELLCDHLAIEATGPGFMWAFAAFVLPLSYSEASPAHPPNTLRLRLALDLLRERNWRPHMDGVAPGVTAWLESVGADAGQPLPQPFAFLRDQLLVNAPVLRGCARTRAGPDSLDPVSAEPAAWEAADLLDHLILPVGTTHPLEPRSILLGGWAHAFRAHGDEPSGLVQSLTDSRLQDLVGKAIEMSTVATAWRTP